MGVLQIAGAGVVESDPDAAVPVGAVSQVQCITARRTIIGTNGELRFTVEEPALLYRGVCRFLPDQRSLARTEVKAKPLVSGIQAKHELVVTEYPYNNGWWMPATFKPALHRTREERERIIASVTAERSDASGIDDALDGLEFDPFESGRWLTAALTAPRGSLTDRKRSGAGRAFWVFGVCACLELFVDTLYRNAALQEMLEVTAAGQLFVGPPGHRRQFPKGLAGEANGTMLLAVNQALAGPPSSEDISVLQLAKNLYRNHLYNLLRR